MKTKSNITPYRYFDWFITTPSMLITLMAFLEPKNKYSSVLDFLQRNAATVAIVLVLNWSMLTIGLLGELKYLDERKSALIGFIPFVLYFGLIYYKFITPMSTKGQKQVYFYFLFFWSIYGIAAMLPYEQKNAMYNILDLFAKNFFGLFLVYLIYTNPTQQK
jgi:bacteriorhodopsin